MPAYVEHKTLVGEHGDSVNTVSFSPCGKYLASGSSDHSICIWSMHSGSFLFRVVFDSAINILHWHPAREETLICGCDDGSVLFMSHFRPDGFEKKVIRLGIKAPVFCMDIDVSSNLWAIGVGNQVNITAADNQDEYTAATRLPAPPKVEAKYTDNDLRVRPRALHFLSGGRKLIASYLNHGIVVWNIVDKTVAWHVKPPSISQIASSAICHDMNVLVVSTLQDGLCLYKLGGKKAIWIWDHEPGRGVQCPLSVAFLHGGRAVVSGATTGNICVWNTDSKDLYQVLPHGSDIMQAVATYQQGAWNYIAVRSALKGQGTYIKIWKANISSYLVGSCSP
ncbi:WD40-repeat-containing domain protein [Pisolithus marmoratus]|nr:WD40-repeat-containing domain protein [Pisolithus marmoratus]